MTTAAPTKKETKGKNVRASRGNFKINADTPLMHAVCVPTWTHLGRITHVVFCVLLYSFTMFMDQCNLYFCPMCRSYIDI